MRIQFVVVFLLVFMKDEKKYLDLVDVLDQFEVWVCEIYVKVGFCNFVEEDYILLVLFILVLFRLDQLFFYFLLVFSEDDFFVDVKIFCFGDQLIRVRLVGVKDLRVGCYIFRDRFDYFYFFRIVDWYVKRSFFKV